MGNLVFTGNGIGRDWSVEDFTWLLSVQENLALDKYRRNLLPNFVGITQKCPFLLIKQHNLVTIQPNVKYICAFGVLCTAISTIVEAFSADSNTTTDFRSNMHGISLFLNYRPLFILVIVIPIRSVTYRKMNSDMCDIQIVIFAQSLS